MNPDKMNAEHSARTIARLWPELYREGPEFVLLEHPYIYLWLMSRGKPDFSIDALQPAEQSMIDGGWWVKVSCIVGGKTWATHWHKQNQSGSIEQCISGFADTEPLARAHALIKAKTQCDC